MRTFNIILIGILFLFLFSNCKKKSTYPTDIPKWLQDRIKAIDDDNKKYNKGSLFGRNHNCHYVVAREVDEYFTNSSTYYAIGSGYNGYLVYDYNGVECCYSTSGPPYCAGTYTNFVRNVWVEDCQ